jgi:phage terminase large subunit-like protein
VHRARIRAAGDRTADRRRAERDRKRAERAAARALQAAARPAAPDRPGSLVEFAEGLIVTQGEHAGERLTVLPWQAAWLRAVEAMAGGELGLSVPAGSGKTTLAATVAAAAVTGPLVQARAAVILVSASFTQSLIGFDHVRAFLQPELEAEPERWRVLRSEQAAVIEDRLTGVQLRAREANARTLHGSAPALIVADEPAQWAPTQRDQLHAALRSRLGKIPGARLLAIGTRPDDAQHWFARLLARPSGTVYAAPVEADPFSPETWAAANPSLHHLPALRAVYEREAAEAQEDPSLLPAFRALRLNLGTADHEIAVLVSAEQWQDCEVDLLPAARGRMVLGFDLSGGDAMAAVAAYWPGTGRLEALAAFPELPDLAERGRTDGADYETMHADGDLLVIGRRVVDVAELVNVALERWGRPARIIADYHHERELRQALDAADFPPAGLVTASMGGLKDSPGRVRDFRRMVKGGRVWCAARLLIRQSMANARTVSDSMGEERLIKGGVSGRRRTARDDVAVAIAAAVSEGARAPKPARRRRHFIA